MTLNMDSLKLEEKPLDQYEVVPGFVSVTIRRGPLGISEYIVKEPQLTQEEETVLSKIRELIVTSQETTLETSELEKALKVKVLSFMDKLKVKMSGESIQRILYYIMRDSLGYGKVDPLLKDSYIEDVHINGPGKPVYVWHSRYEHLRTNIVLTEEELDRLIIRISQRVRKNVNSANPILEGLLPEGLRVELGLREVSPMGPMVTVRKFRSIPFTIVDLVKMNVISPDAVAYLWLLMEYGNNVVIIGPTGAGKTTLLNALLYLLRPDVRIVTVEDTRELNLFHEQWVALVTRESDTPGVRNVDMYDLVKISMRIRPDYLIIGELRGSESYVFFQALASGHTGLTTLHAGSVASAVRRLIAKPMNVPKSLLPMANIFVNIRRVKLGDSVARRVVEISEFVKLGKEGVVTNRVYSWSKKGDQISRDRESILIRRIEGLGLIDEAEPELARREALISYMVKHGFSSPNIVFRIIRNYHTNPEGTLKVVQDGEIP